MKFFALALAVLAVASCSSSGNNNPVPDAGNQNQPDGGTNARYDYFTLEATHADLKYLSMAIDATGKVGVAYFQNIGAARSGPALDGGQEPLTDYEVRYVEAKDGVVSASQKVATVQRVYGISVAFQQSGEPAVAYLGGGSDMSAYWFQSDAVVSLRTGSAWAEQTAATQSTDIQCPSISGINGFLVGVFPALGFVGNKMYFAWRDGHYGQFPQQDWAGSDLKVSEKTGSGGWSGKCVSMGEDNKLGYGGHVHMAIGNGQPAVVHDKALGGADTTGQDVIFQERKANGTWSAEQTLLNIGNTQSGATIAYDSQAGFGVAAIDRNTDQLVYTSRPPPGTTWQAADPVYGSGSGGWYPSLAFDPINHEPAIAFYVCSLSPGVSEGACQASEDELRVTQRIGSQWQEEVIDTDGAYLPQMGFLPTGKRVIVYRIPADGTIRMAAEK